MEIRRSQPPLLTTTPIAVVLFSTPTVVKDLFGGNKTPRPALLIHLRTIGWESFREQHHCTSFLGDLMDNQLNQIGLLLPLIAISI